MNSSLLTTLIAAIPPTLAAIAAFVVAIRTERKAKVIHALVNGRMTAVTAELAKAHERIGTLESTIAGRRVTSSPKDGPA